MSELIFSTSFKRGVYCSIPHRQHFLVIIIRLVSGSKKRKQLSSEEQEIRKKEDAIFEELSKNPLFAVGIERGSNETTESAEAEKEPSKKVTLAKKKTGNK